MLVFGGFYMSVPPVKAKQASHAVANDEVATRDECNQWAKNDAAHSMQMSMDESERSMYMLNATPNPMPIVCLTRNDPSPPPRYDGIGTAVRAVPGGPFTQAYFNQGLQFYYAFNNRESYRALRYAASVARPTPACAMCY